MGFFRLFFSCLSSLPSSLSLPFTFKLAGRRRRKRKKKKKSTYFKVFFFKINFSRIFEKSRSRVECWSCSRSPFPVPVLVPGHRDYFFPFRSPGSCLPPSPSPLLLLPAAGPRVRLRRSAAVRCRCCCRRRYAVDVSIYIFFFSLLPISALFIFQFLCFCCPK